MKYILPSLIVALALSIVPLQVDALSSNATDTWTLDYIDTDEDYVYDAISACTSSIFTVDNHPTDSEYDTLRVFEVTASPELLLSFSSPTYLYPDSPSLLFNSYCFDAAIGTTYNLRSCAFDSTGETPPEYNEEVCNEDEVLITPAEFPTLASPTDSEAIIEAIHDTALPFYYTMAIVSAIAIFYVSYRLIIYPFFRSKR